MQIKFEVLGKVRGKARARTMKNGFSFTPAETVNYENLIKVSFQDALANAGVEMAPYMAVIPIKMSIRAIFMLGDSAPKKMKEAILYDEPPCLKAPDTDNICKIICDALNKVGYADDRQVYDVQILKVWGPVEKVEVTLDYQTDIGVFR